MNLKLLIWVPLYFVDLKVLQNVFLAKQPRVKPSEFNSLNSADLNALFTLGAGPKPVCHQFTGANFTWNS